MITSGRICTSKQDRLKDADEHVYTSYPTRDALHLFPQLTFFFFFFFFPPHRTASSLRYILFLHFSIELQYSFPALPRIRSLTAPSSPPFRQTALSHLPSLVSPVKRPGVRGGKAQKKKRKTEGEKKKKRSFINS